ncbi:MAG: glycosyltransferase [Bacteroidales bacterium]|nr:glycosyltransferase [Bacteroidales bacterium]
MVRLSIIIPAYNVEAYITRCLDSIVCQVSDGIEVLVVNDGSTDNTGTIIDGYAERFPFVNVIHKDNGGVGSARNVGLDNASGEWVLFVDADDWLNSDAIVYLLNELCSHYGVDIFCYGVSFISDGVCMSSFLPSLTKTSYPDVDTFYSNVYYHGEVWCYLFCRRIIDEINLRFSEGINYAEDGEFTFRYFCQIENSIVSIPVMVYNQLNRIGSAMNTEMTLASLKDHYRVILNIIDFSENNHSIYASGVIRTQIEHYIRCVCQNKVNFFSAMMIYYELLKLLICNISSRTSIFNYKLVSKIVLFPLILLR